MNLYPQLGPVYLNEPHKDVLARREASYAEAITLNLAFWNQADIDTRYYAGDQNLANEMYGNLPGNRRRQFSFNHVRRCVEMPSGYQRDHRKSIVYTPGENGDAETADQYTKIMLFESRRQGILETISDCFHEALITGLTLGHVWIDYRNDPVSGELKFDKCSYNSFLMDPFWRKADLSDCNYIWKRSYLTRREILSLIPDQEEAIMTINSNGSSGTQDSKFQFMPENYNWNFSNLIPYDEYYYRDYRTQRMLVDTESGEVQEWRGQDEEQLKVFLQQYPQVTVIKQEIPTVRMAVIAGDRVLYDGPNPSGIDLYPFVPFYAYYTPQMPYYENRVQGLVRGIRDAQFLYNRRKVIEMDIMESQPNSGWIYHEDALVNPKDVWEQIGQGKGIAVKSGVPLAEAAVKIQAAAIDGSMFQVSEGMAKEMPTITGITEENFGSASDDIPGILSMLRQGAGLTTMRTLFDQLDRSQKLLGEVMLQMIQANYTPGKVQKILEGKQPAPQFYNKAFGKYHVAVEDGLNTSTQRQMEFAQLLQLKELGVPIPDKRLVETATIQNKKELLEEMQQMQQQQQQMQQMQLQAQVEEQKARTDLAKARAVADRGLGLERVSRVQENKALAEERKAAALRDEEEALLTLVKTIKELDGMNLQHLHTMVQIAEAIKGQQEQVSSSSDTTTGAQA